MVRQLGPWRGSGAAPTATYRQLADGVRTLVLDGRVPLDLRLPGERDLATALGVSRTTVGAAFGLLREEGYLESRQGSGSRTRVPAGPRDRSGGPLAGHDEPGVIDLASASLPASSAVHGAYATAGPRFGVDGAFERFVRLPFTRPVDELTVAVQRLAAAWHGCAP